MMGPSVGLLSESTNSSSSHRIEIFCESIEVINGVIEEEEEEDDEEEEVINGVGEEGIEEEDTFEEDCNAGAMMAWICWSVSTRSERSGGLMVTNKAETRSKMV